jgi:hypothetical protein
VRIGIATGQVVGTTGASAAGLSAAMGGDAEPRRAAAVVRGPNEVLVAGVARDPRANSSNTTTRGPTT